METTNNNHYADGHQHQRLCYTFFHPSWRGGSHASKEDNNNNLDEKKYSKQKSPTLLTAILQKCAKGTEVKDTRKRKRKERERKGMQQYMAS